MNLLNASEYTGKRGLYCGAYLDALFVPHIEQLCEDLGLPPPERDELHCTIMYSRENAAARLPSFTNPINALICSVQHWVGHNGKTYVVADLQSMNMCNSHAKLHNAGAKHSFPAFKPHITLGKIEKVSDDFQDKIDAVNWKLKGYPKHIVFTDIRVNDINED